MPNTLIPSRLEKKCRKLSLKMAKIREQENKFVKEIEKVLSDKTIREVFEVCCKGSPKQKMLVEELKAKYEKGDFGFDDYMALNELYDILGDMSQNKEYCDE